MPDYIKPFFFQDWNQKKHIPGKGLRNGLRNEHLFLFLAQTIVSCSENRAREGGCQGAMVKRCCLSLGVTFFESILGTNFFTPNYDL